ncbi:MAG: hypothetical protein ACREX8_02645, partial [Gammaproteobacteria bacterium]
IQGGAPQGDAGQVQLGGSGLPDEHVLMQEQASRIVAYWEEAVRRAGAGEGLRMVMLDGIAQPGWERDIAAKWRIAAISGHFVLPAGGLPTLPAQLPATGALRWHDGTVTTVALLSAEATLQAMWGHGCVDCTSLEPLHVTAATLTDVRVRTDRGDVAAPAWRFAFAETTVSLPWSAVGPPDAVVELPDPGIQQATSVGVIPRMATVAADDRTITLDFDGGPPNGPCQSQYTARAVESPHVAVVIIEEHRPPRTGGSPQACVLSGQPRSVTMTLAEPLGRRILLDVREGAPIRTTR